MPHTGSMARALSFAVRGREVCITHLLRGSRLGIRFYNSTQVADGVTLEAKSFITGEEVHMSKLRILAIVAAGLTLLGASAAEGPKQAQPGKVSLLRAPARGI